MDISKGIRGLGRREQIRLRANGKELMAFRESANVAGLSLSAWARMVLREDAISRLNRAGKTQEAGWLTN
jgi:hypothetical protein